MVFKSLDYCNSSLSGIWYILYLDFNGAIYTDFILSHKTPQGE